MTEVDEGGLRPQRGGFLRESTYAEVPDNPSWLAISDAIQTVDPVPDANTARQDALGDPRAQGFFSNDETHELELVYHLQQWFVDGSGDPVDLAADGILRNADNEVENSHSLLFREEHSTEGGTADAGRRLYYVVNGARIGTVDVPFVTDRSLPIEMTVTYQAQKIRPYDISQPASSGTLDVVSTDAGDTTQTLTIEDEGANTTEDVSLNGTTTVPTSASFADVDAAELDAETTGDVTITDGSGNTLMTIYGQDSYEHNEGDLGVPALGTGSHASTLGSSYEIFNGDSFVANTGTLGGTDARIISAGMQIENNLDDDAQSGQPGRYIFATSQDIMVDAEVAGPQSNAEMIRQHLQSQDFEIQWTADGGSITFTGGKIMDGDGATKEVNAGRNPYESGFEFAGITLST